MENKKWTNRDWFWLVGILVGIMIFMVAGFYNSERVEMNFSIISSAVSIALALIAIFIALKQDSDNQVVNLRVSDRLLEISGNLKNVNDKVNKIDIHTLNVAKEETVEDFSKETKEQTSYTPLEVDGILKEFGDNLTDKIYMTLSNKSKSEENNNFEDEKIRLKMNKTIFNVISRNPDKTDEEVREILEDIHNIRPLLSSIARVRKRVNKGLLEDKDI